MSTSKQGKPIGVVIAALVIFLLSLLMLKPGAKVNPKMDFQSKAGESVPMDAELTDETGKVVKLGDYYASGRPVMILPIFYGCGAVCRAELNSLTKIIAVEVGVSTRKTIDSVYPGRDFEVVVLSLHPEEDSKDAAKKKKEFFININDPLRTVDAALLPKLVESVGNAMHFTVGKPDQVKRITDAIGVNYTFDKEKNWVNHPGIAAYTSKTGTVTGYNTGDTFASKMVRNSIANATLGQLDMQTEVKLLGCIQITSTSPAARYLVTIVNVCASLFVLGLIWMIYRLVKSEPKHDVFSEAEAPSH
jgi:protein SCO1